MKDKNKRVDREKKTIGIMIKMYCRNKHDSKIDPDIIIPVHTEKPEWFNEMFGKKTRIPQKGLDIL